MRKIIMFGADWCAPCNMTKPIFLSLQTTMPEVEFQLVNIEEENETAVEYNITAVPTFILLKDNQEVARRAGSMNEQKLKAFINQ